MTRKWELRYLSMAKLISSWSKDPSTKVGAIAVGQHGQVLAQGYNGFPRGIVDLHERLIDRETKYAFTIHAEMNCIYNSSLSGVSLAGSTMYVYGLPMCHDCAKGALQSGVKAVVCAFDDTMLQKWEESWKISRTMFEEAGVAYSSYSLADVK
jgi:dCMP deaminase